jgi:hypothetical protein
MGEARDLEVYHMIPKMIINSTVEMSSWTKRMDLFEAFGSTCIEVITNSKITKRGQQTGKLAIQIMNY